MRLRSIFILLVPLLSACASYRPIVDLHDSHERAYYERDLADCQAYARRVDPAAGVITGAFIGGLIGAALGAAIGDHSAALDIARIGAVEGAIEGGAEGAQTQVDIIRSCLSERGYHVLN